ncbi:helix-turn-helix domain-containing protein [Planobispora siamensis]|nr:helix-turn-helix domain-containing protein [Planobispora siamensis]
MTVPEAAKKLRVAPITVYRAVRSGEMPGVRIGRTYRVPRAFIDRIVQDAEGGMSVVVEDYAAAFCAS